MMKTLLERSKLNGNIYLDLTPIEQLTGAPNWVLISEARGEIFCRKLPGNWSKDINESSIQRNNNSFMQFKTI